VNPRRLIAAAAAVLTVLVLQATIVTAVSAPLAISLPAVLVAAVGLEAGPSAGMSVGFSVGLLADLGSRHPAGVLALLWLLLGIGTGLLAHRPRRRLMSIVIVAIATSIVGLVASVVLTALNAPAGPIGATLALALPSALGNLVLAVLVVPITRAVVRAVPLRTVLAGAGAGRPAIAVSSAPARVGIDG
jgi:cell shape-determining protein MreD